MKKRMFYCCAVALLTATLFVSPVALNAAYTLKEGKLVSTNEIATLSAQEHYGLAVEAYEKQEWAQLVRQATIVLKNFPSSPFSQEAVFYLAAGYFNLQEYEMANLQLSEYLKKQATPKHFEEAIQYKFSIAEKFKGGAKKHLMGWQGMPKWLPAREDAIAIYDEVITALPHHDLGAQALFGKARLLLREEEYKSSVETYQTLIRRFPKHPLAAESYVGVGEVYLSQCKAQYPDPDFLDLAEINLRKFGQDFPREEKLASAKGMFVDMQEIYAKSLYETAQFFERTKKPHASLIYYSNIIAKYPQTQIAKLSQERLDAIKQPDPVQPESAKEPAQQLAGEIP